MRFEYEKLQKEKRETALTPHQVVKAALNTTVSQNFGTTLYDMGYMNKKVNCANCGKEITVNKYARNISYCSEKCKDSYNENNYLI